MNQTQRIKGLGRAKKEAFESALDQGTDYECNNNGAEKPLDVAIQYKKLKSPTSSVNTVARWVKNCKLKANKLCKKQKISLILGDFADPWSPGFSAMANETVKSRL